MAEVNKTLDAEEVPPGEVPHSVQDAPADAPWAEGVRERHSASDLD